MSANLQGYAAGVNPIAAEPTRLCPKLCPRRMLELGPRRRQGHAHDLTLQEIAAQLGISRATVGRIVARCGGSRLRGVEVPPTSRRYERAQSGELLQLDIKKLARGSCGRASVSAAIAAIPCVARVGSMPTWRSTITRASLRRDVAR